MAHRGVALITGGAGGLGLASAHRWLKSGGRSVRLVDLVSASVGASAASGLESEFGKGCAEFVQCDVTDGEALRSAFRDVDSLSFVMNNAGIVNHDSNDIFKDWKLQMGVNLDAVIDGTQLAMEAFAKQRTPEGYPDGGDRVIVNVGSMAGLIATSTMPVYTASKFGVVGFSRAMHVEAKRHGVRVHALCPSFTDTGMINEDIMTSNPVSKKGVDIFGGLMTSDYVIDAMYDKLIDDSTAKSVLRITPLEGVAYDEPGLHPSEVAIRNAYIKANPVRFVKKLLGFTNRKRK